MECINAVRDLANHGAEERRAPDQPVRPSSRPTMSKSHDKAPKNANRARASALKTNADRRMIEKVVAKVVEARLVPYKLRLKALDARIANVMRTIRASLEAQEASLQAVRATHRLLTPLSEVVRALDKEQNSLRRLVARSRRGRR